MTDTVSDTAPTTEEITLQLGEWVIEHYTTVMQALGTMVNNSMAKAKTAQDDGDKVIARLMTESAAGWTDIKTGLRLLFCQLPEVE